jgi:hypothetical protein
MYVAGGPAAVSTRRQPGSAAGQRSRADSRAAAISPAELMHLPTLSLYRFPHERG